MMRHGSSHGMAVLVCTLSSGFLIGLSRDYMPELLLKFRQLITFCCALFGVSTPPESIEPTCLAVFLAFIWGVAFRLGSKP